MKKNLFSLPLLFLFTLLSSIFVVSCDDPPKPSGPSNVTGVTLRREAIALKLGSTEILIAIIAPDNADNKTVKWHSDRPEVATIDENTGKVTAISEGVAIITATTNNNKQTSCRITVTNATPIYTETELTGIATTTGLTKEYILMNDISVSNWMPMGNESNPFMGKFYGNNHTITISGFRDISGNDSYGLFSYMGKRGEVSDLKVVINQTTIKNDKQIYFGGITGHLNGGIIDSCIGDIFIKASGSNSYVGGLAGRVGDESIIRNCYVMGAITAEGNHDSYTEGIANYNYAGGIAGYISGSNIVTQNCYTTSNINARSSLSIGIIITSDNCYNYAGGIVGYMSGIGSSIIKDCYTTGNIASSGLRSGVNNNYVGGIAGFAGYPIQNCYAIGKINASFELSISSINRCYAGGIVGSTRSNIRNCVALNSTVYSWSGMGFNNNPVIHRIGYKDSNATLRNNYGSVATAPIDAWVSNSNGPDGADCPANPTESWWRNTGTWFVGSDISAWDFTNVWQWDGATGLPKLRNMPQ